MICEKCNFKIDDKDLLIEKLDFKVNHYKQLWLEASELLKEYEKILGNE